MAHYVLSDLHGERDRFRRMLEMIRFSEEDTLYILGDVVDRGPDGILLIEEIMDRSNMVMLLGNHEHMMLEYLKPDPEEIAIRRWDRNGNGPTIRAFEKRSGEAQRKILDFLKTRPGHLELEVNGTPYYLVHGFPADTLFEEVWRRPKLDTPSPIPDFRVIIGHTPVQYLIADEEERNRFTAELEEKGEHLRITHTDGFIDVDCGCGHHTPVKALACLRLEDLKEYYA